MSYCTLIFNDYEGLEDERTLYINPDCYLSILLDYLQKEINIQMEFDLCKDNGELLHLFDFEGNVRGTQVLTPFATYYVCAIERDEAHGYASVVPLLKKRSDMALKLRKYLKSSQNKEKNRVEVENVARNSNKMRKMFTSVKISLN